MLTRTEIAYFDLCAVVWIKGLELLMERQNRSLATWADVLAETARSPSDRRAQAARAGFKIVQGGVR